MTKQEQKKMQELTNELKQLQNAVDCLEIITATAHDGNERLREENAHMQRIIKEQAEKIEAKEQTCKTLLNYATEADTASERAEAETRKYKRLYLDVLTITDNLFVQVEKLKQIDDTLIQSLEGKR